MDQVLDMKEGREMNMEMQMQTHNGQHCVIVSIVNAYTVEIHTRDCGARHVYFTSLRESEPGEIRRQMKAAREYQADNSELWPHLMENQESKR